jgi:hypothetical protein
MDSTGEYVIGPGLSSHVDNFHLVIPVVAQLPGQRNGTLQTIRKTGPCKHITFIYIWIEREGGRGKGLLLHMTGLSRHKGQKQLRQSWLQLGCFFRWHLG